MDKTKKVQPNQIPYEAYKEIEEAIGKENITADRATIECYSRFGIDIAGYLKKHAKDPSNIPACIVLPDSTEDIQAVVRIANKYKIPFIPMTNGQLGAACMPTTPAPTICIHFSRMNRVLELNEEKMTIKIEPYVDYGQVQA